MADVDYLLERASVDEESGCWEWQLSTDKDGYGKLSFRGETWRAHRWSYHFLVDYLHKSQVVHHICANRACVRPEHLQRVTNAENTAEMLARTYFLEEMEHLRDEVARLRSIINEQSTH